MIGFIDDITCLLLAELPRESSIRLEREHFSMTTLQRAIWLVMLVGLPFIFSAVVSAAPPAKTIPFWDDHSSSSRLTPNHGAWQELLDTYLVNQHPSGIARFDYASVSDEDEKKLLNYVAYLQQLDPRQLNKARQKAYWINLYNATIVLYVVLSGTDDSLPRVDRGEFWTTKRFTVALQDLSFNDIEHGILRPIFQDERIHFALTRAALGSANLAAKAFTAENTEELLEDAARQFVNHPRGLAFNEENEIELSRVFKWYDRDFGRNNNELKSYIKKYVDENTARRLDRSNKIRYQFDWSLNKP